MRVYRNSNPLRPLVQPLYPIIIDRPSFDSMQPVGNPARPIAFAVVEDDEDKYNGDPIGFAVLDRQLKAERIQKSLQPLTRK